MFSWFRKWNKFENRSLLYEVKAYGVNAYKKCAGFLGHPVTYLLFQAGEWVEFNAPPDTILVISEAVLFQAARPIKQADKCMSLQVTTWYIIWTSNSTFRLISRTWQLASMMTSLFGRLLQGVPTGWTCPQSTHALLSRDRPTCSSWDWCKSGEFFFTGEREMVLGSLSERLLRWIVSWSLYVKVNNRPTAIRRLSSSSSSFIA